MDKKKMLLFGGTGLVGTRIREMLSEKFDIIAPDRREIDLLHLVNIDDFLTKIQPHVVVYAAGITNQESAEANHEIALKINYKAVSEIARFAAKLQIKVIYLSTDAVFSERIKSPHVEGESKDPINFYGTTKALGEDAVLESRSDNLVLRLVSVYTANYKQKIDFARLMVKMLSDGNSCYGIVDQYFNPTLSDNICHAMSVALDKKLSGILHVGASDFVTNLEFSLLLAKEFGFDKKLIKPILSKKFFQNNNAKRSRNCSLDTKYSGRVLGDNVLQSNHDNINSFHKMVRLDSIS